MKRLTLLFMFGFLTAIASGQIQMNSSGRVGIGMAPYSTYKLSASNVYIIGGLTASGDPMHFYGRLSFHTDYGQQLEICSNGNASVYPATNNTGSIGTVSKAFQAMYAYDYADPSDSRQKENVKDISNALDLILKLKGVTYDLKKEFAYNDSLIKNDETITKLEAKRKNKVGFIAQDVLKVLPSVVLYDDSVDIYAISYSKIVPVLVEAIKEQQAIIESLQSEIKSSSFKSTSTILEPYENNVDMTSILYQNSPNPFAEETKIEYYLSDNIQNAMINIYDMSGAQLLSIPIHLKGYSNITIKGNELEPGMYMYTLIADGTVMGTKNMILTD